MLGPLLPCTDPFSPVIIPKLQSASLAEVEPLSQGPSNSSAAIQEGEDWIC